MVYATAEKVEIIEIFMGNNQCANRTAQIFDENIRLDYLPHSVIPCR